MARALILRDADLLPRVRGDAPELPALQVQHEHRAPRKFGKIEIHLRITVVGL